MEINQLIPLMDVDEKTGKYILELGIKGEIELFTVSVKDDNAIKLSLGRIQLLLENHPQKVVICFESIHGTITPELRDVDFFISRGKAQRLSYRELRIHQQHLDLIEGYKVNLPSDQTSNNIIGALLNAMLGETPGKKKISVFETQSAVIEYLSIAYKGLPGMSKRTLEERFALGNSKIDDWKKSC